MMVRAMASPFVEEHKAVLTQKRVHLAEPDIARCVVDPFNQLGAPAHCLFSDLATDASP
jgi:hypothetical protein